MRVAGLGLWIDARRANVQLVIPPCHAKFIDGAAGGANALLPMDGELVLCVRNQPPPSALDGATRLCLTDIWELWLDRAGRYLFAIPEKLLPKRLVAIDNDFRAGEVIGDFASTDGAGLYPLQGMEILLFANWLAGRGDLILHAAGVAVNDEGYAFAGVGGAGKSTLAAKLARDPSVTVLGEDQVILRHQEGRFWIYGTPWHENPAMCAPLGVPLRKLFFVDRAVGHSRVPCTPADGVGRLLQTAFVPYYRPDAVSIILDRLALLAEQVPFYALGHRLDSDPMPLVSAA